MYQDILKSIVGSLGFATHVCDDGSQGIQYMGEHEAGVALLLLDIYIPKIDGISVLGHLRIKYPQLPIVVVSGSDDNDDERVVRDLGALDFIRKPFQAETIHATLKRVLGNASGHAG